MLYRILTVVVTIWGVSAIAAPKAGQMEPPAAMLEQLRHALHQNPYRTSMRQKAQDMVDYTRSEAYQQRMDALIGQVFPKQASARRKARHADDGYRLYLFISSSIPVAVLRRYARQLEGIPGAVMVMRGFVQGATRMGPTARFVRRVLTRDAECKEPTCPRWHTPLVVDPVLFQRYRIYRVPAVVTVGGLQKTGDCSEGNEDVVRVAVQHRSLGDAPVRAHLEQLAEQGDRVAEIYLQRFDSRVSM